jgi:hypothetical protein
MGFQPRIELDNAYFLLESVSHMKVAVNRSLPVPSLGIFESIVEDISGGESLEEEEDGEVQIKEI